MCFGHCCLTVPGMEPCGMDSSAFLDMLGDFLRVSELPFSSPHCLLDSQSSRIRTRNFLVQWFSDYIVLGAKFHSKH